MENQPTYTSSSTLPPSCIPFSISGAQTPDSPSTSSTSTFSRPSSPCGSEFLSPTTRDAISVLEALCTEDSISNDTPQNEQITTDVATECPEDEAFDSDDPFEGSLTTLDSEDYQEWDEEETEVEVAAKVASSIEDIDEDVLDDGEFNTENQGPRDLENDEGCVEVDYDAEDESEFEVFSSSGDSDDDDNDSDEWESLSSDSSLEAPDFGGLSITIDSHTFSRSNFESWFTVQKRPSGWNDISLSLTADYDFYHQATKIDVDSQVPALLNGVWSMIFLSKLTSLCLHNIIFEYDGLYMNYVVDLLERCPNLCDASFLIPRHDSGEYYARQDRKLVKCDKLQSLSLTFVGYLYTAAHILPYIACPNLVDLTIQHEVELSDIPPLNTTILDPASGRQKRVSTEYILSELGRRSGRWIKLESFALENVPWVRTADLLWFIAPMIHTLLSLEIRSCPLVDLADVIGKMNLERQTRHSPAYAPNLRRLVLEAGLESCGSVGKSGSTKGSTRGRVQWSEKEVRKEVKAMLKSRRKRPAHSGSRYLNSATIVMRFEEEEKEDESEDEEEKGSDEEWGRGWDEVEKEEEEEDDVFEMVV
ncbi:hypothetical protein K435DRAFT_780994, partial [Dendrothele bispora CBS 962.96]